MTGQSAAAYRLVNPAGPALPGQCYVCGSAHDPVGFVDTGCTAEFHGAVYLCMSRCIAEMARLGGFVTPEQATALRESRDVLADEVENLTEKLRLYERLDTMIKKMGRTGDGPADPDGRDSGDGAGGGVGGRDAGQPADGDGGGPVRPAARRGGRRIPAQD